MLMAIVAGPDMLIDVVNTGPVLLMVVVHYWTSYVWDTNRPDQYGIVPV